MLSTSAAASCSRTTTAPPHSLARNLREQGDECNSLTLAGRTGSLTADLVRVSSHPSASYKVEAHGRSPFQRLSVRSGQRWSQIRHRIRGRRHGRSRHPHPGFRRSARHIAQRSRAAGGFPGRAGGQDRQCSPPAHPVSGRRSAQGPTQRHCAIFHAAHRDDPLSGTDGPAERWPDIPFSAGKACPSGQVKPGTGGGGRQPDRGADRQRARWSGQTAGRVFHRWFPSAPQQGGRLRIFPAVTISRAGLLLSRCRASDPVAQASAAGWRYLSPDRSGI